MGLLRIKYNEHRATGSDTESFIRRVNPFVCCFVPSVIPSIRPILPLIRAKGFTLIELIVTLMIGVILILVAVPGMSRFINNNRLSTVANDFIADLSLARSEALKRGAQAGVCKGNASGCAGAGTPWANGWIVFADVDQNETWSANDVLLRVREALPANTAITVSSGSNNPIIYGSQGQVVLGTPETFFLCNSQINRKKDIELTAVGRHSVTEGNC